MRHKEYNRGWNSAVQAMLDFVAYAENPQRIEGHCQPKELWPEQKEKQVQHMKSFDWLKTKIEELFVSEEKHNDWVEKKINK